MTYIVQTPSDHFIACSQKLFGIEFSSDCLLPFISSKLPAGFSTPADDYIEDIIDLNKLVSKNLHTTFVVRTKGTSMVNEGIQDGDYLVVDHSIQPQDGKIVVVSIDGNVTVKKLSFKNGNMYLLAANPAHPAIKVSENNSVRIFGVVVSVVHFV